MARTRLTLVGKIFVLLMGLFYVACITSQSGLLLLFVGLVAGCYVVNWSFSRRNASKVVLELPRKATLVEGGALNEPWQITNPTRKHIELLAIHSGEKLLFQIPFLKVGETLSLVPDLIYERRGVYTYDNVVVSSSAPYGLLKSSRKLKASGEVVVLPRVYDAEAPTTTGLELISGGKLRGRRRVNSGTNFAGVRGWQSGDAIKQVHWKSTARRGELMVKTFEEELGGRVSIIVDGRITGIPKKRNATQEEAAGRLLDACLRAAGSLASAALQAGDHLEFVESISAEPLRLAPFSDEGELLERLARYRANFPQLEMHSLWKRSALVLMGVEWHDEWIDYIEEAGQQNREITIYLPDGAAVPANAGARVIRFSETEILEEKREGSPVC